jgi:hypothetical protein
MSKANTWENGLLLLVFNNTAFTLVGDAGGLLPSAAPGSLYVSLHTGDPGEGGDQTTSEAAYTSYARVAVARSGAGWTVAADAVANAAAITFPTCTGLTAVCTYFGVGTSVSGAGKLIYSGALTAQLSVSNGITPEFATGDLDISED